MKTNKLTTMDRIGVVFLTWKRFLQQGLNPYTITLKQFFVLRQLVKNEFLFPAQVARLLFCDRPTVTVIIRNMERQGWINREKDPENRKQIRISITSEGREKLNSIPENLYREDKIPFDPFSCFSDKETEQFKMLMKKLFTHFQEIQ